MSWGEARRWEGVAEQGRRVAAAARLPYIARALGSMPPTPEEIQRVLSGQTTWCQAPGSNADPTIVWQVPAVKMGPHRSY